jgi:hypothetical protein
MENDAGSIGTMPSDNFLMLQINQAGQLIVSGRDDTLSYHACDADTASSFLGGGHAVTIPVDGRLFGQIRDRVFARDDD